MNEPYCDGAVRPALRGADRDRQQPCRSQARALLSRPRRQAPDRAPLLPAAVEQR